MRKGKEKGERGKGKDKGKGKGTGTLKGGEKGENEREATGFFFGKP